eukprot:jgi/Tetstr1/440446/TSEL_003066.t1
MLGEWNCYERDFPAYFATWPEPQDGHPDDYKEHHKLLTRVIRNVVNVSPNSNFFFMPCLHAIVDLFPCPEGMELRVPISVFDKRHLGQHAAKTWEFIVVRFQRKTYRVPEKGKLVVWLDIVTTPGHFAFAVWQSRDGALVAPVFIYDSCVSVKLLIGDDDVDTLAKVWAPFFECAHISENPSFNTKDRLDVVYPHLHGKLTRFPIEFFPLATNSPCFSVGNLPQTVRHFGFSDTAANKIALTLDIVPTKVFTSTAASGVRKLWWEVAAASSLGVVPWLEQNRPEVLAELRKVRNLCTGRLAQSKSLVPLGVVDDRYRMDVCAGNEDAATYSRPGLAFIVPAQDVHASPPKGGVNPAFATRCPRCKEVAGVSPCFRIFLSLHPNTGAMMPGPEWQILSYHVPGMAAFLPEVDHKDEAYRRMHETARTMAAAKEMRHWSPEAHIGDDDYILEDVKAAV